AWLSPDLQPRLASELSTDESGVGDAAVGDRTESVEGAGVGERHVHRVVERAGQAHALQGERVAEEGRGELERVQLELCGAVGADAVDLPGRRRDAFARGPGAGDDGGEVVGDAHRDAGRRRQHVAGRRGEQVALALDGAVVAADARVALQRQLGDVEGRFL